MVHRIDVDVTQVADIVQAAHPPAFGSDSVVAAIEEMKAGRVIVVTDDESRENEGE
jgi:hypothetical protein